jgi:hypothetical protein
MDGNGLEPTKNKRSINACKCGLRTNDVVQCCMYGETRVSRRLLLRREYSFNRRVIFNNNRVARKQVSPGAIEALGKERNHTGLTVYRHEYIVIVASALSSNHGKYQSQIIQFFFTFNICINKKNWFLHRGHFPLI